MAFQTKLALFDGKVFTPTGSTLTLSGQTVIADSGNLRYESERTFDNSLDLVTKEFVETTSGSGITASTTYNLNSPAAVTVGGVTAGTDLTGKTSNEILEEILVPVLNPTLSNPSNGFSDDATNTQEVGVTAGTINFTATFNRGSISPDYGTSGFRSGLPNNYNYGDNGNVDQSLPADVASTSLTDNQALTDVVIQEGSNTWNSSVDYDAGEQPLDSQGGNFGSPLAAGTTGTQSTTITGIYPYFYGTVNEPGAAGANRPSSDQTLINGNDAKVVATSTGTISVDYNSTSDDYIWFATPATSTTKTVWFVTALNNGTIGGSVSPGGNLFPDPDTVSINSPTGLWSSVSYKIYVSNVQTEVTDPIEFRNS